MLAAQPARARAAPATGPIGATGAPHDDPVIQRVLDRAANQPRPILARAAMARGWNAATVARLAEWARGTEGAATAEEVALLTEELRRPVALRAAFFTTTCATSRTPAGWPNGSTRRRGKARDRRRETPPGSPTTKARRCA